MRLLPKSLSFKWTIARRIALAFGVMGCIAVTLAVVTLVSTMHSGDLVIKSFDESVVTTNFARATADDFSRMRSEFAQSGRASEGPVTILDRSFGYDLSTALEKLPVPAMADVGQSLRATEALWLQKAKAIQSKGTPTAKALQDLNSTGHAVDETIETMVNIVGEAAYEHRQTATAMVAHDAIVAVLLAVTAVVVLSVAALFLYRGIRLPLRDAVGFANDIAGGRLDGQEPKASGDEIGTLIKAMTSMRIDIKGMMEEQVVLRESSQARVAEALDSSRDGIIVADGRGIVQIANARALDFLGIAGQVLPSGTTLTVLRKLVGLNNRRQQALIEMVEPDAGSDMHETILPDGRRIQNSRNRTSEGGFVGLYTDISTLADQKANLDAALANMTQGLCVFDAKNRLKVANRQFYSMFGLDPATEPPGTSHETIIDRSLAAGVHAEADGAQLRRHVGIILGRRRRRSRFVPFGDHRILAAIHEPMPDGGWLATFEDVTERHQAEARIAFLANHDALTGLPNRTMLAKKVDEALARAGRGQGFAMMCIDLDQFKQVNDTLGHSVGDALLKSVAERLTGCLRKIDVVARLGGDEFAVLQANVTDVAESELLARRIVEVLSAPYRVETNMIAMGASIGIALAPKDGLNYGDLLKRADVALYKSKDEGRGTWRFFEPAMDEKLKARRALEGDLNQAVAQNEFELHYQPLLDITTMEVRCFEALVRWQHPLRGLVPPGDFISVAEEMGIIKAIGAWVLRHACLQAVGWPAGVTVAVNVSIVQLRDEGFVDTVMRILEETGLSPLRLELEITESVFMSNNAKALAALQTLKGHGVRFSMDDFGTGYSSLSYLRRFAFDKLKIDRSFLNSMMESEEAEQIVRTIIVLGKNLGMRVTAEGVETPKQMARLQSLGCDEIQGYLIGRPMPATSIRDTLEQHNGPGGVGRRAA